MALLYPARITSARWASLGEGAAACGATVSSTGKAAPRVSGEDGPQPAMANNNPAAHP
ncbi:hypothetical protein C4K26_0214 [Pseudomonas chlororaphis]|nr:hypothetical protein C4K26_0214 [Pseudomonas chlororaphis]